MFTSKTVPFLVACVAAIILGSAACAADPPPPQIVSTSPVTTGVVDVPGPDWETILPAQAVALGLNLNDGFTPLDGQTAITINIKGGCTIYLTRTQDPTLSTGGMKTIVSIADSMGNEAGSFDNLETAAIGLDRALKEASCTK